MAIRRWSPMREMPTDRVLLFLEASSNYFGCSAAPSCLALLSEQRVESQFPFVYFGRVTQVGSEALYSEITKVSFLIRSKGGVLQ
ncbi:MAG: hypothetical protein ACKVP2_13420 [Burkholderiales bacterium]